MINKEDWEVVQKVQKAISDWGQHEEINNAIIFFEKKNPEAYKILIKMAEIEASRGEEVEDELRPLFFKLKEILSKDK